MTGDVVWRRADRVLWRRSADRVVLLCPGHDEPVALAGTGAAIWSALETPRSERELVRELATRYGTAEARVDQDLPAFLAQLRLAGAVAPV